MWRKFRLYLGLILSLCMVLMSFAGSFTVVSAESELEYPSGRILFDKSDLINANDPTAFFECADNDYEVTWENQQIVLPNKNTTYVVELVIPEFEIDEYTVSADLIVQNASSGAVYAGIGINSQGTYGDGTYMEVSFTRPKNNKSQMECMVYNRTEGSGSNESELQPLPDDYVKGSVINYMVKVTDTEASFYINNQKLHTIAKADLTYSTGNIFFSMGSQAKVMLDNITVYDNSVEMTNQDTVSDNVKYIAHQNRIPNYSDTFDLRFVAVVSDASDYSSVGFNLKVTDSADNIIRDIYKDEASIYKNLIGYDGGEAIQYDPNDYSGKYFTAITLLNIPKDLGELTFEITPYAIENDGEMVFFNTATVSYNGSQRLE